MPGILLTLFLFLCGHMADQPNVPRISGETKYKPHSLVRLRAEGLEPKDIVLWRVYPSIGVQRATTPRDILEFVAHPGVYEVELLVIRLSGSGDAEPTIKEVKAVVEIEGGNPPTPPPTPPAPSPKPKPADPVNAIGRLRFGNVGCTATVIGPRRSDGRWDVLTAAHCVPGAGARGTLSLKDGRTLEVRVVSVHRTPDVAWCVTEAEVGDLPFALIAPENPSPGTAIWHMGYGVDRPGNREEGTVAEGENSQGQLRMVLSVSSGDSGGGIFRSDTNELVSVVCCTSGMAKKVSMWGASTSVIRRTRPQASSGLDSWIPIPIPIRKE